MSKSKVNTDSHWEYTKNRVTIKGTNEGKAIDTGSLILTKPSLFCPFHEWLVTDLFCHTSNAQVTASNGMDISQDKKVHFQTPKNCHETERQISRRPPVWMRHLASSLLSTFLKRLTSLLISKKERTKREPKHNSKVFRGQLCLESHFCLPHVLSEERKHILQQ